MANLNILSRIFQGTQKPSDVSQATWWTKEIWLLKKPFPLGFFCILNFLIHGLTRLCVYLEFVCATSLSLQLHCSWMFKNSRGSWTSKQKPDTQNPTATYLVEVVYMVVPNLKQFFALHSTKKTLQGIVCKKIVSGYSKDYVVPYLSLVWKVLIFLRTWKLFVKISSDSLRIKLKFLSSWKLFKSFLMGLFANLRIYGTTKTFLEDVSLNYEISFNLNFFKLLKILRASFFLLQKFWALLESCFLKLIPTWIQFICKTFIVFTTRVPCVDV